MVNILCGMQHSLTPFGKMKLVFPRDYYMQISFPLGVEVCVQVSFHFYCRMLPWLLSSYDQCFPWFRGLSFLVSCILSGTCTFCLFLQSSLRPMGRVSQGLLIYDEVFHRYSWRFFFLNFSKIHESALEILKQCLRNLIWNIEYEDYWSKLTYPQYWVFSLMEMSNFLFQWKVYYVKNQILHLNLCVYACEGMCVVVRGQLLESILCLSGKEEAL